MINEGKIKQKYHNPQGDSHMERVGLFVVPLRVFSFRGSTAGASAALPKNMTGDNVLF